MDQEIVILAEGLGFPEGPAFAPDGSLWCVDAGGGTLVQWQAGRILFHDTGGSPTGLAFDGQGRAWFCDGKRHEVRYYEPETGRWATAAGLVDGRPLNRPNDLGFDAVGNLVFSCPDDSRFEPTGYVACLPMAGRGPSADVPVKVVGTGLFFPNGIVFSADGQSLMVAETYGRRVWKGRWDPQAALWLDAGPWAELGGEPGPDGMALGADGLLYVAALRAGQVKAVNAEGQVVRAYDVPSPRPTNVAFDPSGRLGMVVTESATGKVFSLPGIGPGVAPFRPRVAL